MDLMCSSKELRKHDIDKSLESIDGAVKAITAGSMISEQKTLKIRCQQDNGEIIERDLERSSSSESCRQ